MEILNDTSDKRTVLVTLAKCVEAGELREHLGQDFELVCADGAEECLSIMTERFNDLSAAIVDVDLAKAGDYALLRRASADSRLATIPIIVASLHEPTDEDARCLDEGAIDFMLPPYQRRMMKQRIDNALRIKRSTTFHEIESMLRELPSNIFLKDTEGRYVFSTHYWHHLDMGDDPNWTIRGKTDLEIRKDRENAIKAMKADREIVRTGKGTSYVIEINADGQREFMQLIKRPVFDKDGNVNGIIALINDVTEHELLKRELEKRARTDELTGLGNRRAFDEFIFEIPRRDDFPIAVISADCNNLKSINDTHGHLVGDEYIRLAGIAMQTALERDDAHVFRTGGDEFVALLPHTTAEEATEAVAHIRRQCDLFKVKEGSVSTSFGVSEIANADASVRDALAHADREMYADKAARKGR